MKLLTASFALVLALAFSTDAQHLKRRPFLGVQLAPVSDSLATAYNMSSPEGGRVVMVVPNSTAEALKMRSDDIVLEINRTAVKSVTEIVNIARAFETGEPVSVKVNRGGKALTLKGKVKPMPQESDPDAEVIYDEVKFDQGYARLILKKPQGEGKFPAVFFLQGYVCNSIDNLMPDNPQQKLIDGLVQAGYAVLKMDKPGSGDSQGSAPCPEILYQEELEAFSAALKKLKTYQDIDAENIFLFGHSLGANTAPIIAMDTEVRGIVAYGVAGKPWYEYMQDVFREQQTIEGKDPAIIDEEMLSLRSMLYEFMIEKKTPEELYTVENEELFTRSFDYDGQGHMFGRSYKFMQGINDAPFFKAWKEADTKVLAIYGEADIAAISPANTQLMVNSINLMHPGSATYHFLPYTDHGFIKVGTKEDLFRLQHSGQFGAFVKDNFNHELVEIVDKRMKGVMGEA